MVKTRIEVPDALWRIVKLKGTMEDKSKDEALATILKEYIENHGEEYGYRLSGESVESAESKKED